MSGRTHGHTRHYGMTPEYRAYNAMKTRCSNPRQRSYKDYGGRGIKVCDRWLHGDGTISGFECFLADVGPKPSSSHSLDRKENDKNYEPGNVRWATKSEQARNTRVTVMIDICGVEIPFADAVEQWGDVSLATAHMRAHRGWSFEDAVFVRRGCRPIEQEAPF
jgi:hypothetical protein